MGNNTISKMTLSLMVGFLLAIMIIAPLSASAETIYMKDGSALKGTIKSTKRNQTVISTDSGDIAVDNSKIMIIDHSEANAFEPELNKFRAELAIASGGEAPPTGASTSSNSKDLNTERLRIISEKQRLNAEKLKLLEEEQKLISEKMKIKGVDYSKEYTPDFSLTKNNKEPVYEEIDDRSFSQTPTPWFIMAGLQFGVSLWLSSVNDDTEKQNEEYKNNRYYTPVETDRTLEYIGYGLATVWAIVGISKMQVTPSTNVGLSTNGQTTFMVMNHHF